MRLTSQGDYECGDGQTHGWYHIMIERERDVIWVLIDCSELFEYTYMTKIYRRYPPAGATDRNGKEQSRVDRKNKRVVYRGIRACKSLKCLPDFVWPKKTTPSCVRAPEKSPRSRFVLLQLKILLWL